MEHLPLTEKHFSLFAFTAFCTADGGMSGFGAHFRSDQTSETKTYWSGSQLGMHRHYVFKVAEYITSTWVQFHHMFWFPGPYLLVT